MRRDDDELQWQLAGALAIAPTPSAAVRAAVEEAHVEETPSRIADAAAPRREVRQARFIRVHIIRYRGSDGARDTVRR